MSSNMLLGGLRRLNVFIRAPALPLTLGLVGWLEAVFTIEWSFPYCTNQEDGLASAVFGMPLPYVRWSGVSSMEYIYMPSIFVVNIAILFAITFPVVTWAVNRVASPDRSRRRGMLRVMGLALLLSVSAWNILLVQSGLYRLPVSTIASGYETYNEFRPVRFTFKDLHYDCTPSSYWFKDGWRPKSEKVVGTRN